MAHNSYSSPEQVIEGIDTVMYFAVVAAAILVYDYILTLEQEVKLLWPTRLTTAKVLFLVARYTPFLDQVGVVITYHLLDSSRACTNFYKYAVWSYAIGFGLTQVILALRSWAIWGRDRRFGIGLGISLAMIWVAILVLVTKFQNTLIFSIHREGLSLDRRGHDPVHRDLLAISGIRHFDPCSYLAQVPKIYEVYEQSLDSACFAVQRWHSVLHTCNSGINLVRHSWLDNTKTVSGSPIPRAPNTA